MTNMLMEICGNVGCYILIIDRKEFITPEYNFVKLFENSGYEVIRGVRALRTIKKDLAKELKIGKDRGSCAGVPDFYLSKKDSVGNLVDEFFCEVKFNDKFRGNQIETLKLFSEKIKTRICIISLNTHIKTEKSVEDLKTTTTEKRLDNK